MKKISASITSIGILSCVGLFFVTMLLQIKTGLISDAGIYLPAPRRNMLWVLLIACLACGALFLLFKKRQASKASTILSYLLTASLLLYGCLCFAMWGIAYHQANTDDMQSEYITSITLDDLTDVLNTEDTVLIYIGRKSCSLCEQIKPELIDFAEAYQGKIFYYSTEFDRTTRREEMENILKSLKVTSIPMTIAVQRGQVVKQFSGAAMAEDLEKNFATAAG